MPPSPHSTSKPDLNVLIVHLKEAVMLSGEVATSIDIRRHRATIEMASSGVLVGHKDKSILIPYSNIKSVEFKSE